MVKAGHLDRKREHRRARVEPGFVVKRWNRQFGDARQRPLEVRGKIRLVGYQAALRLAKDAHPLMNRLPGHHHLTGPLIPGDAKLAEKPVVDSQASIRPGIEVEEYLLPGTELWNAKKG